MTRNDRQPNSTVIRGGGDTAPGLTTREKRLARGIGLGAVAATLGMMIGASHLAEIGADASTLHVDRPVKSGETFSGIAAGYVRKLDKMGDHITLQQVESDLHVSAPDGSAVADNSRIDPGYIVAGDIPK